MNILTLKQKDKMMASDVNWTAEVPSQDGRYFVYHVLADRFYAVGLISSANGRRVVLNCNNVTVLENEKDMLDVVLSGGIIIPLDVFCGSEKLLWCPAIVPTQVIREVFAATKK